MYIEEGQGGCVGGGALAPGTMFHAISRAPVQSRLTEVSVSSLCEALRRWCWVGCDQRVPLEPPEQQGTFGDARPNPGTIGASIRGYQRIGATIDR